MMADLLQSTDMHGFRKVGHDLASRSGVGLQSACPTTVRAWEARGLACTTLPPATWPKR